ncbi:hypothetical protein CIW83_00390 [Tissierella sp. P1]|uniref:GNAT family N-acetyltransferase n=1 Tax=Tissierella sp. P1 TaxID=1280483 RepID=UPI000BA1227A|nr:GNAT family N-acetyltransferase [Tissierella sp. P1]OZV13934.1 hypothetical protein CIW83_00390 [Tissierella sp. P1]
MIRPNVDLNLKVAVVAPDGNFVSYCGMWYDPEVGYAVVEPVATDPDYRRMGLGKAAVLEGIKRVGKLGAKTAWWTLLSSSIIVLAFVHSLPLLYGKRS